MDLHETWYERRASTGHPTYLLLFIPTITPRRPPYKLLR